jgi:hypothetical protein
MRKLIPILLAVSTISVVVAQYPDVHPRLKGGQVIIHKALLLPAQLTFAKVSMKGAQGMTDESDKLAVELNQAIAGELKLRGVDFLPDAQSVAKTDTQRYAIADLQARYDNLRNQLHRRHMQVDVGKFSMGDGIAAFAPAKGADAMVFVRGDATLMTPDKRMFSLAIGQYWFTEGLLADIAMVDARTGDVLAYVRILRHGNMTKDQSDRLTHSLRMAFRDVPLPVKPPKN